MSAPAVGPLIDARVREVELELRDASDECRRLRRALDAATASAARFKAETEVLKDRLRAAGMLP